MPKYLIKKTDIKANFRRWHHTEYAYIIGYTQEGEFTFPYRYVKWVGDRGYLGSCSYPRKTWALNNYFKNWQNPTKTEVDVFEMVTGEKYLTHYLGVVIE